MDSLDWAWDNIFVVNLLRSKSECRWQHFHVSAPQNYDLLGIWCLMFKISLFAEGSGVPLWFLISHQNLDIGALATVPAAELLFLGTDK